MSSESSISRQQLSELAAEIGASRVGCARASRVPDSVIAAYDAWITSGRHGDMAYMAAHRDLRLHPDGLLPGARSVIAAAFSYFPARRQRPGSPRFAYYSYGQDYHTVVRRRLQTLADRLRLTYGGDFRVCVDTAPIFERYWAQQAGVGFRGRNSQLIVPGMGSYFFIGLLLTTLCIDTDLPLTASCPPGCRLCIDACPGRAILHDGTIDARRCLSYLTIESRQPLPPEVRLGGRVYGCDTCQTVCPLNRDAMPTDIAEFQPSEEFLSLTHQDIAHMTQQRFSRLFSKSAVKRAKLAGLLRNEASIRADRANNHP